jgi:hypothetical protein
MQAFGSGETIFEDELYGEYSPDSEKSGVAM